MESHTNLRSLNRLTQQIMNKFEIEGTPFNMFKYIDTIHHWILDPNTTFFNIIDLGNSGEFLISAYELDFIADQFAWAPYCKKDIKIIKNWMKDGYVEKLSPRYLLFAMEG